MENLVHVTQPHVLHYAVLRGILYSLLAGILVYALMYVRAKSLLKVIFCFVYYHLEHSSDKKKKGLHFFLSL